MANKGEKGSPGEDKGDEDVKFKGKLSMKHISKESYRWRNQSTAKG